MIASLRDMITKQDRKMEEIRAGQKALEAQNDTIRAQNETLRAQNDSLKEETETLKEEIGVLRSEIKAIGTNRPTWAAVAAQGNAGMPVRPPNASHIPAPQTNQQNLPGINLDLSGLGNPQFDSSNIKEIRERVRQAFDSHASTKEIGWIGIARRGNDQSKIRICLRTQEEAAVARRHDEWLNSHFRGARVQGEQWYPVKVDRVNKNSVCDESRVHLRDDACAKISTENGVSIRKMRFIGRPDPDKLYCSVALYLTSKQEADDLLHRKYIDVDGEVAYTRVYEPVVGPRRCFNCHKFTNHEARRCPAREPTCGLCARVGHAERDCASEVLKCVNCSGPHKVNDRGCLVYKRLLQGMNPTRYDPES
jgi:hypothetical protein